MGFLTVKRLFKAYFGDMWGKNGKLRKVLGKIGYN